MTPSRLLLAVIALFLATPALAGYESTEAGKAFIQRMVDKHGLAADEVRAVLADAQRKDSIIKAITRPAEGKPWKDYRNIFMTESRIDGGVKFMREHADILARAEKKYGVPPHIITAIIGVETRYGGNTGSFRVIDALATLGFDYPKRGKFFLKQLEQFLLLAKEEGVDPRKPTGSYAGAMGLPQFIPSSFRAYAVDFDGDGVRDIWTNTADVIGSVANYFKVHGWQAGEPVTWPAEVFDGYKNVLAGKRDLKPAHSLGHLLNNGVRVEIDADRAQKATLMELDGANGPERWVGLKNFYVITRYNHSRLYAMAVYQLAMAIDQRAARAG